MKVLSLEAVCLGVFLATTCFSRAADAGSEEAQIRAVLQERIEQARKGVGIVVGIIDDHGAKVIGQGKFTRADPRPVDGETVFEIGSATKVFTSLLLADMVQHGEVKLEDPISKYLPATVKAPTRNGKQITLLDLATHRSGLPRMPDNFMPADDQNPYADYTVAQMYTFLSGYTLPRDIGEKYEYSNFGAGLLGHILALKAGTNYESLVRQRICGPLGLTSTVMTLTPQLKARLAPGHSVGGRVVANWDLPTFAGAGALRSTATDLLKFLSASMGLTTSPLLPAMRLQQIPRLDADSPTMKMGLGWHIATKFGANLVWHNGGTGGYHSFMGFNEKTKRGVVVLANSANGIDDIGFHLLDDRYELTHFEPGKERVAVKLDPKVLQKHVGQYQMNPQVVVNVRPEGDHLAVQLTGQAYYDVYAESAQDFFYEEVDAQITFEKDAAGKTTGLVLHQNKADQKAPKISDAPGKERVVNSMIDPKIYDAYAGKYELAPGVQFTVRREGGRLMVQVTGQGFAEVFPESETEFFYKIVDAQLTFVKNSKGEVTDLILHQNGANQKAPRLR